MHHYLILLSLRMSAHKKNDTQKEGARVFFISSPCYCRQLCPTQNHFLLTAFKAFNSCFTFLLCVMPLSTIRHTQKNGIVHGCL